MTVDRFEEIQKKYNTAKDKAAKAEGAKEQLLRSLKEEYGLSSIEEIETKLDELEKQKLRAEREIKALGEELEEITDWEAI